MDTSLNIQPATPEIVWAMLREIAESQAETARQFKKTIKQAGDTIFINDEHLKAF